MSFTAAHQSKVARRACQACHERKARFQYRGRVRADHDHVLCFECYRSERDRGRARRLVELSALWRRPLTAREVDHRHRMLQHLQSNAASGHA